MTSTVSWTRTLTAMCAVAIAWVSPAFGVGAAEIHRVAERVFLVRDRPGTPLHFQMIVQAGCADEADSQCRGLAHYLEHLILVGRNPDHSDIAMRMFAEGSANGWTNDRATVYVHRLPARPDGPRADLEKLFGFYSARLTGFSVTEADAERERRVVRQEHDQRVGGQPFARFSRTLDRILIPDHPGGQWTIGTTADIDAFTVDAAREFHARWYGRDNAYFVVRGDVEPDVLREVAVAALAQAPDRPPPVRPPSRAPDVAAFREDVKASDADVRRPVVSYRKLVATPEFDPAASRAARSLLADFLTSRLPGSPYEEMVEQRRLTQNAPSFSLRRIAPGVMAISVTVEPAPDVSPEAVLDGVTTYLAALAAQGVPDAIITRLKARRANSYELGDRDAGAVYGRIVNWLADRNRIEDLADWPKRIAAVSHDDIATIVRAMNGEGRVVTGVLAPAEPVK